MPRAIKMNHNAARSAADGGFAAMRAAFERASIVGSAEIHETRLRFIEQPVHLRVIGDKLASRLAPTFAHLKDDDGPQTAAYSGPRIDLWDRSTTGVPAPPAVGEAGLDWRREGWAIASYADHRYLREERNYRVTWLDRGAIHLIGVYDSADQLNLPERARPLARIMVQVYRLLGAQRVHAGLVSLDGRGVLLPGARGSGKTACTLDCLMSGGYDYLGDDAVGIAPGPDGSFWGYSLNGSANLLPFHLARHPDLAAHALPPSRPEEVKALLFPALFLPDRLARRTRIVAVALPRANRDGATRVVPAGRAEALKALVPDNADYLRSGFTAGDFSQLAAMAHRLPCHRIEIGGDPAQVAESIGRLLDGSSA